MGRKALLALGMLSSPVYLATDLVAARRYRGYGLSGQAVSELMATGAPTRPLLLRWFTLYNGDESRLTAAVEQLLRQWTPASTPAQEVARTGA